MPSPPALEDLQRSLREVLADPRGTRAACAARPRTVSWIRGGGPCGPATRLSVYGDGYFLRMLEALAFDYPAVRRVAGEACFRALAAGYVAARPSTSPSLADLGEAFADFVAIHEISARRPFLSDLARLERAVSECLLVDRLPPLSPESLSGLREEDWAQARVAFDPSMKLLQARFPVLGLWRGARRAPAPKRQDLLVTRQDGGVSVRALPAAEWMTLRSLADGAPLAEALGRSAQAAGRIRRWFARWTAGGLIKGVRRG